MKKVFLYVISGVLALTLIISLNVQMRRTAAAELALTENTHAAVAEVAAELDNLTLSLDKLLVTTSLRQTASLLSQITLSADRAQSGLSELPDAQGQRSAVLAYLSRLAALSQTSLTNLPEDGLLSAGTRSELRDILTGLRLLQAELTLAQQALLTGEKLSTALPATELTAPPDALELTTYKALPTEEINLGTALQIAKEFVGIDQVTSVAHAPDTTGALPAFGVTVQTRDLQLNLEVTRRGGKVLLMVPETAAFPMQKTSAECAAAALAFLKNRGFADMEALYYQVYDGLCVLTCAYVQNGVLVWPDRVLVQVRMDTAEVVGLEARSYWKNHIPRKLQSPLLTEQEARNALSAEADVAAVRQCLLPMKGQERLCWQFTLIVEDGQYISYIDAMTGEELLLEKIMQLEAGSVPA